MHRCFKERLRLQKQILMFFSNTRCMHFNARAKIDIDIHILISIGSAYCTSTFNSCLGDLQYIYGYIKAPNIEFVFGELRFL